MGKEEGCDLALWLMTGGGLFLARAATEKQGVERRATEACNDVHPAGRDKNKSTRSGSESHNTRKRENELSDAGVSFPAGNPPSRCVCFVWHGRGEGVLPAAKLGRNVPPAGGHPVRQIVGRHRGHVRVAWSSCRAKADICCINGKPAPPFRVPARPLADASGGGWMHPAERSRILLYAAN